MGGQGQNYVIPFSFLPDYWWSPFVPFPCFFSSFGCPILRFPRLICGRKREIGPPHILVPYSRVSNYQGDDDFVDWLLIRQSWAVENLMPFWSVAFRNPEYVVSFMAWWEGGDDPVNRLTMSQASPSPIWSRFCQSLKRIFRSFFEYSCISLCILSETSG